MNPWITNFLLLVTSIHKSRGGAREASQWARPRFASVVCVLGGYNLITIVGTIRISEIHLSCRIPTSNWYFGASQHGTTRLTGKIWCSRRFNTQFSKTDSQHTHPLLDYPVPTFFWHTRICSLWWDLSLLICQLSNCEAQHVQSDHITQNCVLLLNFDLFFFYTYQLRNWLQDCTLNHLLLDSAPNLGPLISRWEINKFENRWYKIVRIL